jgi:hypothetical protein
MHGPYNIKKNEILPHQVPEYQTTSPKSNLLLIFRTKSTFVQTHALDRTATGIGELLSLLSLKFSPFWNLE